MAVNGGLMVASFHTLHFYSLDLVHQYDVSHPQFVGLHEISAGRQGYVWVAATILDLALELNLATGQVEQQVWARDLPGLQAALGVSSMVVDKTADNRTRYLDPKILTDPSHLHLSAVAEWRSEIYALLGVRGVIVNLDRQAVVVADPKLKLGHNLHIREDGVAIVLDSLKRSVRFYDLANGKLVEVIDLMRFKWVRDFLRWRDQLYKVNQLFSEKGLRRGKYARPFFLRGMEMVGRNLYIGASPATIICLNLDSGELVDTYVYSTDVSVGIHGLKVVDD
jgi:hypothetical protein